MYILPMVDASALIPRLRFEISGAERRLARSKTRHDFAQLFGRAILRYLKGLGHPEHEVITEFQTLTQGDIASESGSPHTRAKLLLAAFTESKLLPREDSDWNLKVSDLNTFFPFNAYQLPYSLSWKTQGCRTRRQAHHSSLDSAACL